MELSEIVSPTYSVASNMLKLNSSSIASSTPGCGHQGPLIAFEQFQQSQHQECTGRPSLPKKNLTIQIDQDYDFQQHPEHHENRLTHAVVPTPESEVQKYEESHRNVCLREYEDAIELWRLRYQESQASKQSLNSEIQQLKQLLRKKDEQLLHQQKINNDFAHKLAEFQEMEAKDRYYDEKMREKDTKYRQFQKMHEKVVAMNKSLQRQLRESEKKIMELQRQIQKSVCNTQIQNLQKIKQSSTRLKESVIKSAYNINKENTLCNTKSMERKKVGNSIGHKKSVRVSSSSTNIQRKLQIKNSLI